MTRTRWMRMATGAVAAGALLAVGPPPAAAQQARTLARGDFDSGGFGGPVVKVSGIADEFAPLVGLRGGWILDHVFVLGGGIYGLAADLDVDGVPELAGRELQFGYGGLELEYVRRWQREFHLTLQVLVGGGRIDVEGFEEDDGVFVLEPALNLEANVTSFFRLLVGGGWRFVSGVDTPGLDEGDLGSPVGTLTLKFGSF